jgi:hypothetical protein
MAFGLRNRGWEILHEEFSREAAEARQFNRELLIRLEKTYGNLGTTLELIGERIEANTEEVKAQTDAILQLLDYFKGSNGGPPV